MAVSELDLQEQLVVECRMLGGYAIKMSNKFMSGIPDVLLALPDVGSAFVETKLLSDNSDIMLVTKLQNHTLSRMRAAGLWAGAVGLRWVRNGHYEIYCTTKQDVVRIPPDATKLVKVVGGEWPIKDIIDSMRPRAT